MPSSPRTEVILIRLLFTSTVAQSAAQQLALLYQGPHWYDLQPTCRAAWCLDHFPGPASSEYPGSLGLKVQSRLYGETPRES